MFDGVSEDSELLFVGTCCEWIDRIVVALIKYDVGASYERKLLTYVCVRVLCGGT